MGVVGGGKKGGVRRLTSLLNDDTCCPVALPELAALISSERRRFDRIRQNVIFLVHFPISGQITIS